MNKTTLKQGTLAWEKARERRIGSSEVFDLVRYYATDAELQNCGINPEAILEEKPYTTAWALYHKMLDDGIYQRQELPPELADYGHAIEPYGLRVLQEGRKEKLKAGAVFANERLIASLDVSGISEEVDVRPFDYGNGLAGAGKLFVCEQKSMMPQVLKKGLPLKYIIQAQYQIAMTGADFYILQLVVLKNDTEFERGKIVQMSLKKRCEYLKQNATVTHIYFNNNEHLAQLIKTCIAKFFEDVDACREPTPFLPHDKQKNILESIRINTFYNNSLVLEYDLTGYRMAKERAEKAEERRLDALQKIIETAKRYNASRFRAKDGTTASFSAAGAFLVKPPKG